MIHRQRQCESCREAKHPPATATKIGTPVLIRLKIGRGSDDTIHTFLQCPECGDLWVELRESGVGGHGRFYRRLTVDLF